MFAAATGCVSLLSPALALVLDLGSIVAGITHSLGPASLGLGSFGRVGVERPLLFATLPVALAAVTVLFYLNPGPSAPRGRTRRLMVISRVCIAVLLITASAGPYLVNVDRSAGDPEVHLLVDESASMDIYDTDPEAIADSIEAEGVPVRQTTIASGASSPVGDEVLRGIETGSHVVLLSDGRVTSGRSLGSAVDVATEQNVTISGITAEPVRTERLVSVDAPETTTVGAAEVIRVSVGGVGEANAELTVTIDGEQIHQADVTEPTAVELDHTFEESGDHRIKATIDAGGDAGFDRNTVSRRVVDVAAPPKVLYVSRIDYPMETYLSGLYDVTRARSVPDRAALEKYHSVVIQDLAADDLGNVAALQSYAADGNGVVVVGGQNAYDRGGYASSPITTMLPVRFEEQKGGDDIVLLVDVSGSAEEQMPRIRGLALDVIGQIGNSSRVGIVAFANRPQVVSEFRSLESDRAQLRATIRRLQAGGGTDIGAGLRGAGELLDGGGEVILISDGVDDSGQVLSAAGELAADDVRVTSVGFGSWRRDARLTDIAGRTGGTYVQPDETSRLQLVFNSETSPANTDSLVIVDQTHFITTDVETETDLTTTNDVNPRRGARSLVTTSEGSPALTSWRFGLGRVVSVTAYADDGSLGGLLRRPDAELTTRSVNWAVGDPRRKQQNVTRVSNTNLGSETRVIYRGPTRPQTTDLRFVQTDSERFEATITPETVGYNTALGAEYAVEYPAEYEAVGQSSALQAAVDRTGGRLFAPSQTAEIASFTQSAAIRERSVQQPLGWVFLVLALAAYLGEVVMRRLRQIS